MTRLPAELHWKAVRPRPVPTLRRSDPPTAGHPDEFRALAEAIGDGDRRALRTFVVSIVPRLLRVVRRVLGADHPELEDATYQAAHAVVDALPRFRGEGTILHFACRVAVLTAMNVRRRDAAEKRPRIVERLDHFDSIEDTRPTPEQSTSSASLVPIVRQLISELPEALAETLTLHVIVGYTVAEIAQSSGTPVETVRSRLRLAKRALRKRVLANPVLREVVEVDG